MGKFQKFVGLFMLTLRHFFPLYLYLYRLRRVTPATLSTASWMRCSRRCPRRRKSPRRKRRSRRTRHLFLSLFLYLPRMCSGQAPPSHLSATPKVRFVKFSGLLPAQSSMGSSESSQGLKVRLGVLFAFLASRARSQLKFLISRLCRPPCM